MSSGTVKPRVMCRLSPNEEAALLRQQREERRKARLLQVREQERSFAKKVRNNVRTKKQEERRTMEEHLEAVLAASREAELLELEAHYQSRQRQIGRGHKEAQYITQEENRLQEARLHLKAEQRWQAKQRHSAAMKELTSNQLRELEVAQHPLVTRKRALAVEKKRAKHIAVHKPHPTQPLIKDLTVGRGHKVQLKEAEGFASTYYNIPSTIVQRVAVHHQGKPSAQEMAEATSKQDESFIRHSSVAHQEQQEKAWLRHKHALAKVKLEQEKADVISQLRAMEREDRVHRQKSLAKMPANMFQHTQRRVELGCEQQRDMEQAFEGLFIKTHGVHNHPTLSQIARQDGSPSPSDTSHSTTTQDSSSTTEPQHKPADKSPSQQRSLEKPTSDNIDSHSPTNHSKNRANRTGHDPSSQQPRAVGVQGDPSALSITMLSSDYSSFQQKESLLKPHPLSMAAPQPNSFSLRASRGGPVTVPSGEMEPSEQSFESTSGTTASEEGPQTTMRSPPLFQCVAPSHPTGAATMDMLVSDVTESDVQELTSTTSRSTSDTGNDSYSGSSSSAGVMGGALRPPIKGILKHPAEKRTHPVAPSVPTRRGEGMQKLVSMIRAQHQAWSERLAARANRLQSTISQMEDTPPTASFPPPPSHQSEPRGTHLDSYPTLPTNERVQEEERATPTHPSVSPHRSEAGGTHHSPLACELTQEEETAMHTHPSLSSHQNGCGALHQYSHPSPPSHMHMRDEGGASYQHHAPPSHDQIGGGATHHYPPLALDGDRAMDQPAHGQSWGGVKTDGPTVIVPKTSASHHDSLSIFTLSTRDSTRSPEPDVPDPGHGSTVLSERGALTPETLSITQYHTTVDSLQPTAHLNSQDDPATGVRNSHSLRSPSPFATEYRVAPPNTAELDNLASLERAEPPYPPADVRVHPPNTGANLSPSLEPMAPQAFLHSNGLPAPNASLAPTVANMLGSDSQYTPATSLPHPLSPSFSPWGDAISSYPLPLQFLTSPFIPSNTVHPYSNHQGPPLHHTPVQLSDSLPHTPQPLRSPLQMPLSGAPVTTAISAIPTPMADLHHPLSSNLFPLWSAANSVSIPPDFHQLSFATPQVHAVQDTCATTGFPTTPTSSDDQSLHNTIETSFELETLEHPYPHADTHQSGIDGQYHSEASPELAALLLHPLTPQMKMNTGTTTHRLAEATPISTDVVQTQPSSEQLSIITLETSHTHSEQPAIGPSPSSTSETEEHCTLCSSQSQDSASDSGSSSCREEREGVDNVNHGTSLNKVEEDGSKPELEGGVMSAIQLHHLSLSPAVNDGSIHEETESSERNIDAHSELKHHHERPPDADSSEDSDSSSNSSHREQFIPLPEQSPSKNVEPEARDDVQSHSPSLKDGFSDGGQFSTSQGSGPSLSLQEAFLRRKEQFVLKSKHRLEQLKENAQKRQAESSPVLAHSTPRLLQHSSRSYKLLSPSNVQQRGQGHGHMISGSGEQTSKAKRGDADVRRRAVTFSSPLAVPQHTGTFTPPKVLGAMTTNSTKPPKLLSSQKREKIRRKEMKERNLRFYNKLPEVKRQREEEKRKNAYSTNRDKAKEYQEKLRTKVKKQGEKKHTSSSQQATKTQTKPKLKRPPFR